MVFTSTISTQAYLLWGAGRTWTKGPLIQVSSGVLVGSLVCQRHSGKADGSVDLMVRWRNRQRCENDQLVVCSVPCRASDQLIASATTDWSRSYLGVSWSLFALADANSR